MNIIAKIKRLVVRHKKPTPLVSLCSECGRFTPLGKTFCCPFCGSDKDILTPLMTAVDIELSTVCDSIQQRIGEAHDQLEGNEEKVAE